MSTTDTYYRQAHEDRPRYMEAISEACNTDCPCYASGTCPYYFYVKMECHRFKAFYNREED